MVVPTNKKDTEKFTQKEVVSIYIDGFNLYHNAIKGWQTKYYFPDLRELCELVLDSLNIDYQINEIHYFTANVKNTQQDPKRKQRQQNYIRALEKRSIKIHRGRFATYAGRTKEKQTDINISVQMLNDAWAHKYTLGVLMSNDSDFVELLRTIYEDRKKKIGVWNITDRARQLTDRNEYEVYCKKVVTRAHIQQVSQIANKDSLPKRQTPRKVSKKRVM